MRSKGGMAAIIPLSLAGSLSNSCADFTTFCRSHQVWVCQLWGTEKGERQAKGERKCMGQGKGEGGNRKKRRGGKMEEKHAHSLLTESFPAIPRCHQSCSVKINAGTVGAVSCLLCG